MKLRPHHLLCTQGYSGRGYNKDFVENMTAITNRLRNDDKTVVEIVFGADDICSKCPRLIGEGMCESDDKVKQFDEKVIDYFDIEEKSYIYQDLVREIKMKMTSDTMDDICGRCEWYAVSACRKNIMISD